MHKLQRNMCAEYCGKVFARVLNERAKVQTVDKVIDEQRGFWAGRGCVDQAFVCEASCGEIH